MILLDINPASFQSQIFWGSVSGTDSKGWDSSCGAQAPHSSRRSCIFVRALLFVLPRQEWGFWQDHISLTHTDVAPLSGRTVQLAFRAFPVGTDPYVAIDMCPWKEVNSESSYPTIELLLSCFFKYKMIDNYPALQAMWKIYLRS